MIRIITLVLITGATLHAQSKSRICFSGAIGAVAAMDVSASAYSSTSYALSVLGDSRQLSLRVTTGDGAFTYGKQGSGSYFELAALYGFRFEAKYGNIFLLGGGSVEKHEYDSNYDDNVPYSKERVGLAYDLGFTVIPMQKIGLGVATRGQLSTRPSLGLFLFLEIGSVRR